MRKVPFLVGAALLCTAFLAGCAQPGLTGTVYNRGETRQAQTVEMGVVESVRAVTIEGRTDGVTGAVAGAAIGGLAGRSVGGGRGRDIATVAGAVAGGVAGQAIEQAVTRRPGVEIMVRLDSGRMISVVQEEDPRAVFRPGDRVRVLSGGGSTRVTF
jgi:outer membrane lipoprotein SlyB